MHYDYMKIHIKLLYHLNRKGFEHDVSVKALTG